MILACPHCHRLNRLPQERLAEQPSCGHCKQPLFIGQVLELTTANFAQHAEKSALPLLVDFWAPWCGPCLQFAPIFASLAAELEPRVRLAKINTEQEQGLAGRFAIRSIPTLMLFQNGKLKAQQSGALPKAQLKQWLQQHLPT